jgi:hypothetical protein
MNNLRDLIGEPMESVIYAIANSVDYKRNNSLSIRWRVKRLQDCLELYYTVVRLFRSLTEREQGAMTGKGKIPVLLIEIKVNWEVKTLIVSADDEETLPWIAGDELCGVFRGVFGALNEFISNGLNIDDIETMRVGYNPEIEWD